MRFGQDPQAVLRVDYPALFAVMKDGGWRYTAGAIEVTDELWAGLSAAQRQELEDWADACGVRSPATERRETALSDAKNVADIVRALRRR